MYEWQGKVVLITGAANGIGACVAQLVLEEGSKHVAIVDIAEPAGITVQNDLNAKYGAGKSRFYKCDVTDDDQLFGVVHCLAEEHGNIDVVVNNAGIMNDSPDVYKKEIAVNFTALVTCTLKAIEVMRTDRGGKGGTIINISSIAALGRRAFTPIYAGTKAAVLHFSNCIGKGLFEKVGVRVLTVCLGITATTLCSAERLGSHNDESPASMYKRISVMYFQKVESAAAGIVSAYKQGSSASTWLATRDLPVRDITGNVMQAYQILGEHI